MRIVLSGGGTGGHIYPALALRKEILKQYPQAEFLYIGTEKGLEGKIVPNLGIDFQTIRIQGLKRSLSFDNVRTLAYMVKSIHQCKKYLKAFQPDVVIGTGGYVCAPVLYQAAKMKIVLLGSLISFSVAMLIKFVFAILRSRKILNITKIRWSLRETLGPKN